MGASASSHMNQTFWFIRQVSNDMFEGQLINNRHLPAGEVETIPLEILIHNYVPEIAYYVGLVLPAMKEQGLSDGTDLDEHNLTSLFGLGLIYATRNQMKLAQSVISEIVEVQGDFAGRGQFLFNEFGIALRKNGLVPEAVECFRRASEFVHDDENLYYNLARACYENDDWHGCIENLVQSHRLNPRLEVTRNLLEVVVGLEENEYRLSQYGKPPVPPDVASRAREVLASDTVKLPLDEGPVMRIEPGRARSGGPPVGTVHVKRHGSDE
ncbi:hypothetical protein PSDVSF_29020 [Pseudodesulfovibrio sediminis]|uniref:Tetratricopeptide repeat protein n=2 Tax=Pseudodesulfovibrio sediminis TaxID=2810563 RepID=A0ABN6EWP4_9BACT|nr:hypothetical protein PSDVSF_29020 [Pseudodesulfovibrio sediminis]